MKHLFLAMLLALAPVTLPAKLDPVKLQVEASRLIRDKLKDPESFEWVKLFKKDDPELGFIIYGTYRAKNSFGGYHVARFIYNGQTLLLSEVHPRFEEAWKLI
jgi:hypothetical protein